jgi:PAS domain S-box-containing protein
MTNFALVLVIVAAILVYWAQEERHRAQLQRLSGSAPPHDRLARLLSYAESMLASMSSGVLVVDTLGRVAFMNREAESILGVGEREMAGATVHAPGPLSGLAALINQARSECPPGTRSSRQYEIELPGVAGTVVPLGVSINTLMSGDGRVLGYVLVCRNLTETRALRAEMEHSRKLTALGTVASGVAHNFNNILTTILGRVQLMLRFPTPAERLLEGLRIIEKSAIDGTATVRRIQDFTRKAPAAPTETADVDANEIVADVVSFTKSRWKEQASERGLAYEVTVEPFPVPPVHGSSSELREVLINLMLNAIDAMPRGGAIRIRTESEEGAVRIRISDSGPGIPPNVQPRIFDPFFTTKGREGSGLGLFESYNIVKRHGGRLLCETGPGKGTCFTIELPAAEVPPPRSRRSPAGSQG